jgi:hypothetical protein
MKSCPLGARDVDDDLEHIGVLVRVDWCSSRGSHDSDLTTTCLELPLFICCFVPLIQRRAIVPWSLDICRRYLQVLSDNMPASIGSASPDFVILRIAFVALVIPPSRPLSGHWLVQRQERRRLLPFPLEQDFGGSLESYRGFPQQCVTQDHPCTTPSTRYLDFDCAAKLLLGRRMARLSHTETASTRTCFGVPLSHNV